ncbi:replicative DNA helicase [Roseofilum sp. BLCC_M91]|uniref:Replicative DNA helicase n=1 Tax=Roseofilum halophilum BLCC-M91 TaxID=3022259 RepID=A0ABT7BGD9_9CYAN|nr:replicative DNA helicase [Roseofilum halophilum]MDJ1178246.1 replicative DNA helicase [Roseofilum halophilum BLCC-M91]
MVSESNLPTLPETLPPQNIEAEESILGGILLDPEAINRVIDILRPEAFSLSAHQKIYQAALTLHNGGKPTDFMTVNSWLSDHNLLDKVGGQGKLVQLLDRTVSAVNIDEYAKLVMDKYLRRQLIRAGHEIVQLGYDSSTDIKQILDQAEQKIFNLTQDRVKKGLVSLAETLTHTYEEIQSQSTGEILPGLPCQFYDLDAMTGGFQRSDLIIIAGRPSMGKCLAYDSEIVIDDGSVLTIAQIYQQQQATLLTLGEDWQLKTTQPSAFVDDGIKPVFRVTTGLGRQIETTLTHPFRALPGWKPLSELKPGATIAVPRQIPIFGSQTLPEPKIKLLAYLIGDGCLTGTTPQFTNANLRLQAEFAQAVSSFPGLKISEQTSQGTRTLTSYVVRCPLKTSEARKYFGQKLRQLLHDRSYSAHQLAKKLSVSPSLITPWLQGKSGPSPASFETICQMFALTPSFFGVTSSAQLYSKEKNLLTQWLQSLGLWGKDAHQKTIPAIIFQLKRSQLALFVNRLFATDGWISVLHSGQVQLGYTSVSETLIRQLQHLLLRFGIIARLKKRQVKYRSERRPAWQLDITDGRSLQTFIEAIGIFGKEEACFKAQKALQSKRYQTNRDLIPIEVWEEITQAKGTESWKSVGQRAGIVASNLHVGRRCPTRDRLSVIAEALDSEHLQHLATSHIYWDTIVSIELVGYKQVYDLTIPTTHNFIANDICVHNTSFALNIANNIAQTSHLAAAIFSLEMSKEQLALRLLSSEAGIESNRLRSGRISQTEWEPLIEAQTNLSELPIYIDDTANTTVTQMRSQVRRLQAEQGQLGLVLLDYLQLMEGSSDNRVQELSKITRQLKGLARELNVPVIALSQLSRSVESRTNKRPMMSDLRESGCLTGDTLIPLADEGIEVPIQNLLGRSNFTVWAVNLENLKIEKAIVTKVFSTGIKPTFSLTTALGRKIQATANHPFLTIDGWKRLDQLDVGSYIALPRILPSPKYSSMSDKHLALSLYPSPTGEGLSPLLLREKRLLSGVEGGLEGEGKCSTTHLKTTDTLANSDLYWDKVVSIEACGEAEVYDLTVPGYHNFVANNIVVHNSIEQDADLVIMLYRDEYYNPDTTDRAIAEAIITKHRNGPTGIVKLLFDPEFTRFRNLAKPHN